MVCDRTKKCCIFYLCIGDGSLKLRVVGGEKRLTVWFGCRGFGHISLNVIYWYIMRFDILWGLIYYMRFHLCVCDRKKKRETCSCTILMSISLTSFCAWWYLYVWWTALVQSPRFRKIVIYIESFTQELENLVERYEIYVSMMFRMATQGILNFIRQTIQYTSIHHFHLVIFVCPWAWVFMLSTHADVFKYNIIISNQTIDVMYKKTLKLTTHIPCSQDKIYILVSSALFVPRMFGTDDYLHLELRSSGI